MDQGSTMKGSAVHNFAPTVTKFCVMWEGQALPHDTKFGNSRCEIVGRRVIFIWSLIHGLRWSGLIKAEPGTLYVVWSSFRNSLDEWASINVIKGKHPIVGWFESGDHLLASGGGIRRQRRRIPTPDASKWSPDSYDPTSGCFPFILYLWNKQQVMSINLTTWSTMQNHVVVDHIVFYVIHSQWGTVIWLEDKEPR